MNRHLRRSLVVLSATAAACVLWVVAVPVAGLDLAVRQAGTVTTVGVQSVAGVSLLVGLAGWGLLALLERMTARAGRTWTIVASVVLAFSLLGPLGAVSAAATFVLLGMHVLVGGTLLAGLARR